MNGNLAQRYPGDVLADIQRSRASGVLKFCKDTLTRQMFLDAGITIRFAVSTLPSENISALFREKGGMTEDQVRQAASEKRPDELLGTTLVRLGFLSKELLAEMTHEHIHRIVLGALSMNEGTYEFQPGTLPFRGQLDAGLNLPQVLLEWARAYPDIDFIRRRFGAHDAKVTMSPRPPEGYQSVPLNPAEGYTMSRIDGKSSIGEICMVSPMGEEVTLRALFGLSLAGILETPGGAVAAPARPVAVPASRAPANGGAVASHPKVGVKPSAPGSPKAARPGAPGARPLRRPMTAAVPKRPVSTTERVRPSATADVEAEMLQRFEQLREQDLYQVLGLTTTAQTDEIRRAYYGLAKKFHPDKFIREQSKAKAEKVFSHITEAYSTLSNADAREKYNLDQSIRKGSHGQEKKLDGGDMARMNFKHGKDMLDKGRIGEAITFLQNACEQDPSKADHFRLLAIAQSKNPRWKKDAEENFLKAIERDPTNGDLYAHLGTLYAKGGLQSRARDMFKKALQWDPANAEAQEGMSQADEKKGILGMFKK